MQENVLIPIADDLFLACLSKYFEDLKNILIDDLGHYIDTICNGDSYLIHQKQKSPMNNRRENQEIQVQFGNQIVKIIPNLNIKI